MVNQSKNPVCNETCTQRKLKFLVLRSAFRKMTAGDGFVLPRFFDNPNPSENEVADINNASENYFCF